MVFKERKIIFVGIQQARRRSLANLLHMLVLFSQISMDQQNKIFNSQFFDFSIFIIYYFQLKTVSVTQYSHT